MYAAKICHSNDFNKEVDWPIAGQDKVRQESQTENARQKKDRVSKSPRDVEGPRHAGGEVKPQATWQHID